MDHKRRELFAPNAACAIGHDRRVFLVANVLAYPSGELPKAFDIGSNRPAEVANIELVISSTVDDNRVAPFESFLPLSRCKTDSCYIKGVGW